VGASLARSVMDAAFAEPLVLVGTALAVVAADNDDDAVHVPWPDSKISLAILARASTAGQCHAHDVSATD